MNDALAWGLVIIAACVSLVFSTLSYALRELSRAKLDDALERREKEDLLDPLYRHADDTAFLTAICRLLANLTVLLGVLYLTDGLTGWWHYLVALGIAGVVTFVASVALPHAFSEHHGATVVATLGMPLIAFRRTLLPVVKLAHAIDAVFQRLSGGDDDPEEKEDEFEAEILSYAEEGEQEGAIDAGERRMIERVIAFRDRTVDQAMTSRPDIVALANNTPLDEVRKLVIESGHSRIPVYEGDLDHIVGILYARDLILRVGTSGEGFNVKEAMRPPRFVFEHKHLADVLADFRQYKIHIAVVRDEYGAVVGLITIEDVLEQLVGEISDEHEPQGREKFARLKDGGAICDGRIAVAEVNHELDLELPEEEDYDTLAGFVMAQMGGIPEPDTHFDYGGARFTVVAAEAHRVNRVRVSLLEPAATSAAERR